jgi:hypothetical protein
VAAVRTAQEFLDAAAESPQHIVINNHLDLSQLPPLEGSQAVIRIGAGVNSITVRLSF